MMRSSQRIIQCLFLIFISLSCSLAYRHRRQTVTDSLLEIPKDSNSRLMSQSLIDSTWERNIVNGPVAVNLLAQLTVLGSRLDFSFKQQMPNANYTYMKYPDSFRATLFQITTEGWQAFLAAHTNMAKIVIFMTAIPVNIRTAFKILLNPRYSKFIPTLLPRTLTKIEDYAKDCVLLSNETHQAFVTVMNLIAEVIGVTETARGIQNSKLREVEIQLNVSRVIQQKLAEYGKIARTHWADARSAVVQAQKDVSTILKKFPTGFSAMLQNLVRFVTKIFRSFANLLRSGTIFKSVNSVQEVMANSESVAFADLLKNSLDGLHILVKKIFPPTGSMDNVSNPLHELSYFETAIRNNFDALKSGKSSSLKDQCIVLANQSLALAKEFSNAADLILYGRKHANTEVLIKELENIIELVRPIALSGSDPNDSNTKSSATESTAAPEDADAAFRMALVRLRKAQERYDEAFYEVQSQQAEMGKLMNRIAQLDFSRINYIDVIQLLQESLIYLGNIREQWSKLILFFSEIAGRTDVVLTASVRPFIDQIKTFGSEGMPSEDKSIFVEALKRQATDLHQQSYLLTQMSQSYVDTSNRFLMPRLMSLTGLLAITDDQERKAITNKILHETEQVRGEVENIIQERRLAYMASVEKRKLELEKIIEDHGGLSRKNLEVVSKAQAIEEMLA